jgi:hypothetical protein
MFWKTLMSSSLRFWRGFWWQGRPQKMFNV